MILHLLASSHLPSTRRPALTLLTVLLVGLSSACATYQAPPPEPAPQTQKLFRFRSDPWLNLHHFLHQQAKQSPAERFDTSTWNAEEKQAWAEALAYYESHLASEDLLFGEGMVELRDDLASLGPATSSGALDRPGLVEILDRAGTVYRSRLWPEHRSANASMIEHLEVLIGRHGHLAHRLAAIYRSPWPTEPILVDISIAAGWAGAYTSLQPTHLTMASRDDRHGGPAALEILLHEASHSLIRPVSNALRAEAEAQGLLFPSRDLWHAVLFYTTGTIVAEELGAYTPYAEVQGLFRRSPWSEYHPALTEFWRPYALGGNNMSIAVSELVNAVGVPPEP